MKNFILDQYVRKNILKVKPYSSARDEFSGTASIFLDANENSLGSVGVFNRNRYPDPHQSELKSSISKVKNIPEQNIFLGNGSDEVIDLIFRIFTEPGKESALILPPTYGMYEVSAAINDVEIIKVQLNENLQPNIDAVLQSIRPNTKLAFICSPNNPTGNLINHNYIEELLLKSNLLIIIDEAYIDFAESESWIHRLNEFPNLIVMQTFSKAWGLANIRIGMAFASPEIVELMSRIKPPYNISGISQEMALLALSNVDAKELMVSKLIFERDRLINEFASIPIIEKIYPSDANFLLIKVSNPKDIYEYLIYNGIVVRDRSSQALCEGCLRVTVGSHSENDHLIKLLRLYPNPVSALDIENKEKRVGIIKRKTTETDIQIRVFLDGKGKCRISTGMGFFDHMLEQLGRHSGCDLEIRAIGDLNVDEHHTIEDTAIALGEAILQALGNKIGIERYGYLLPMDESYAQVSIDFSGRPCLVWNAEFKREKIGDVPTEMFQHFFKSFSDAAKCNLHIAAQGDNEHHKIEGIFKAVAKSIKMAVKVEKGVDTLPSTKGML